MNTADDFWSRRAVRYDGQVRRNEAAYDNRIRATLTLLDKNDRVLDIGCATGEIGLDIASYVASYDGCDPAARMIKLARQKTQSRGVDNASFLATTAFDHCYRRATYDTVLLFSVLHLAPDAKGLLQRAHELLKPGGKLIAETPCLGERGILKRGLLRLLTAPIKDLKICSLSYSQIEKLVCEAGFEIGQIQETHVGDRMLWISAHK